MAPQIAPHDGVWQPLAGTYISPTSAICMSATTSANCAWRAPQEGTQIAASQHEDLKRNMLFNLRSALSQTLQAKAVLELAKADLEYYDKIIDISRDRFKAGDIAQIDLDRIELLRVQYESEIQTAIVNLRTAKIQLLQLLNDRTPVDQFDVAGPFDFSERPEAAGRFSPGGAGCAARSAGRAADDPAVEDEPQAGHGQWLDRSDLRRVVHLQPVVQQPQRPADAGLQRQYSAAHLRPQPGREAAHRRSTSTAASELTEAARAQVFSDVDSAYELVRSNIALLKPYKAKYNEQALRVRDTVTYAYVHGGASLMDFLNAQSDYRTVQLAYAATDRRLSNRCGTTESCRRTRGDSMKRTPCSDTAALPGSPAAAASAGGCEKKSIRRTARRRRRRSFMPAT